MAKIGDYSERALRKQWLNMVQRYRIQKSTLQVTPLNKQCIDVLNEEWEYFGEIHAYMTQRTTDLHSYALKEPNVDQSNNNNVNSLAMRGVVNDHNFCDRSASIKAAMNAPQIRAHQLNMDKRIFSGQKQKPQANNDSFSDKLVDSLAKLDEQQYTLEESSSTSSYKDFKNKPIKQESLSDMDFNEFNAVGSVCSTADTFTDSESRESSEPSDPVAVEESDLSSDSIACSPLPDKSASEISEAKTIVQLPACSETASETPMAPKRKRKAMSEREKYYRHRRRYDHRMEVRLGGLCIVAGQLLEHLVPEMNVAPCL